MTNTSAFVIIVFYIIEIKELLPDTKSDRCQLKITKSLEFDCHLWKDDYEQMQKTE